MDIKQQTQNVAAQGRFGDSMLLHVNPAEVKGLAQAMPITVNPQTGQPEAFLPFLAPVLGSMAGTALLGAGTAAGLSAAAAAGIGAGLATYIQTGGSGSKALLSGLTAGLGTRAATNTAMDMPTTVTTTPPAPVVGPPAPPVTTTLPPITRETATLGDIGGRLFSGGFDEGVKNIARAAMTPSGVLAGTTAGTSAVLSSQEEFERQMAELAADNEERKKRMYEMYPEQIPIASGGSTSFADGGKTGYRRGQNVYYDPRETDDFNPGSGAYYEPGGRAQFMARRARPIPPGFMPGFSPEFRYFQGDDPTTYLTRYARDIGQPQNTAMPTPSYDMGMTGFRPPMPVQPPFMGGRGYRPFTTRFGGFGNAFMQTPSYQSFYGNPQMGGMYNPYARFNTQPIQPYFPQPYNPPVNTPPPSDVPPPSDGGDLPPPDGPLVPPINDNIGRKGRTKIGQPVAPPDDFITPGPVATGPVNPPITPEPTITLPIEGGADVTIPDFTKINIPNPRDNFMSIGGPGGGYTSNEVIGAGGGPNFRRIGNYNIDQMRDNLPVNTTQGPDDVMKNNPPLTRIANYNTDQRIGNLRENNYRDMTGIRTLTPPSPAAPGNTPMTPQTGFKPMGGMPMFGAPMFSGGRDTNVEVDKLPEGLKAMYDSGPKGREGVEKIAAKTNKFQEGQDVNIQMPVEKSTDMIMQDPIVKETIQFILGETDNSDIVNEFIIKYGQEQFMILRNMILAQAAGNPNVQTEGLIRGFGKSGMEDDLPMNIGDKPIAAVSQDEYIIPADVVSMLGDGSSDAGSKQLDSMLDRVRMAKTGGKTQAKPINPNEVLPAWMK